MKLNKIKKSYHDGGYFIYGKHPAISTLQNTKRKIIKICCTDEIFNAHHNLIIKHKYEIACKDTLFRIVNNSNHQGIVVKTLPISESKIDLSNIKDDNAIILILDQITDPTNIGSIIRSAAAFGCHSIISTFDRSPKENTTIAKISAGGIEKVNFVKVKNLVQAILNLKKNGFWIIGLDGNSDKVINKEYLKGKIAIILGAEDTGIRKLTKDNCDLILKIPIKNIESLNVSQAANIALFMASI